MEYIRLSELTLSAVTGLDAIKRAPILDEETGLKCLRIQDISQKKEFLEWGNTKVSLSDLKKTKLRKNDILVARTGATVGVSYYVNEDLNSVFNNGTIRLRLDVNKINPYLVYSLFQTKEFRTYINNISCVATQPNLRINGLLKYLIPVFSTDIQTKITCVLLKYNELIENNNKRIKLLEQMAEELYKEWFVRFRFPGYEKTCFVDGIPEGWKTGKIRDLIMECGKSIKPDARTNYSYYLPIDKIPNRSMSLFDVDIVENAESSLDAFKENDILFGAMRTYFHKVLIAPFDGITRKTCFVLSPRNKTYRWFSYLLLYQDSTIDYSSVVSVGTTMPYVRWKDFSRMNILIPPKEIIDKFNQIIEPILLKIKSNYFINLKLIAQRDLLLPRLMSGKIDLEDKEVI